MEKMLFEKMLWRMAVLRFILYLKIKGGDAVGHVKPLGGGLRGEGKPGAGGGAAGCL